MTCNVLDPSTLGARTKHLDKTELLASEHLTRLNCPPVRFSEAQRRLVLKKLDVESLLGLAQTPSAPVVIRQCFADIHDCLHVKS